MLCACFSPLPLQVGVDAPKIILVIDPPKFPLDEVELYIQSSENMLFYKSDFSPVLLMRPISWFFRTGTPLCSVPTTPYRYGKVHKPPWGEWDFGHIKVPQHPKGVAGLFL